VDVRGNVVIAWAEGSIDGAVSLVAHGDRTCRTTVVEGSAGPESEYWVSSAQVFGNGVGYVANSTLVSQPVGPGCAVNVERSRSIVLDRAVDDPTSVARDADAVYFTRFSGGVWRSTPE